MGRKIICACGQRIVVKDSFQGPSIKCPHCGARVGVGDNPEAPIAIAGTFGQDAKGRTRRRSRSRLPRVAGILACLLGGVVLIVVVWPSLSRWGTSDSPDQNNPGQKNGTTTEARNPFADSQNLRPATNNSNEANRSAATGSLVGDDDPGAPPKSAAGAGPQGVAAAPPGVAPAPPGVGAPPPGVARSSGESAAVNDADDSQAADRVAKLASVIEHVVPCLVRLEIVSARGQTWGSGFVVNEGGMIVTNYHVVEEARTIKATFSDNSTLAIEGFKYFAPARDMAVLQTAPPERELPFLQLAKKDPVKKDSVVAFGSPTAASFSASEGVVNGIRTGKKPGDLAELGAGLTGTWAQISAQVSPDNSGGPLVNRAGDVVGVNATTLATEQNFAVAREELRLALDKARAQQVTALDKLPPGKIGAKAARPAIDADVTPAETGKLARTDLSPQESEYLDKLSTFVWFGAKYRDIKDLGPVAMNSLGRKRTDSRSGVAVNEISDESPSSRAGLQKDDLIATIDGKPVWQASDLQQQLDQFSAGQDVKVSVLRPQPNGRFSKKMLTVGIEALIDRRALVYVATADVPAEVRDFLKRHLLRYAAKLFETIGSAERPKAGAAPPAGGKQPPAAGGGTSVQALRQKGPFAPLFAPAFGTDVPARVGNIGNLERVRVLAVATQKMAVARIKGGLIALLADTSSLIKGKQFKDELFNLGRAQIIGTVSVVLDEKSGRTATTFVARPFAVEAYLPPRQSPPDAER